MECAGTLSWFNTATGTLPRTKSRTEKLPASGQRGRSSGPCIAQAHDSPPTEDLRPAARTTVRTAPVSSSRLAVDLGQAETGRPGPGRTGTTTKLGIGTTLESGSKTIGKGAEIGAQAEPDWSEVVRRCLSGETPAWTELVRAFHRRVYALCYRFTGSGTDAEDLTQEVFLKVYSNLTSFDTSRGTLQVWITTLTRNLLVDHFRRTRNLRITGSLDEGWDETGELRPIDRLEAKGPSQHDQATRRELEKMVQQALAQVSPELREAVILRDLQDMDYKEIAVVLGIPEGTVKSRISRGRAELARLLERNKREVM
jgi:RNA polymerase sigma-70 factor (ECF subfamily)